MGAKRTEYQIVGRYMSGKNVTGYHLQSIETGKSGRYTKEQVCYLVGRDQVTNCTGQVYNDTVLLRGKGMSLDDLPVQYDDGDTRNMDRVGKVRRGTDTSAAMEQFLIVGTIKSGRNTVGYVIQNAGCGIKKVNRKQVIELARAGKIGNARVQTYQGKDLLRGVGCNLDELPSEAIPMPNANTAATPVEKPQETKVRKANTIKIISIPQLKYNGTGRFRVALVDFAVCNPTISRDELEQELEKFKSECDRLLGHKFYNTDDCIDSTIKGKPCLLTFDDPYFNTIADYMKAANKVGAKFVLDRIDFIDSDDEELTGDTLRQAKRELAELVKSYQNK